jgi:hypothetical protein
LVVARSSSEIPEGLMNNPVLNMEESTLKGTKPNSSKLSGQHFIEIVQNLYGQTSYIHTVHITYILYRSVCVLVMWSYTM